VNSFRRSRGVLAVLLVVYMAVYASKEIILGPAQETGLVPIKESRSISLPKDFSFETWVWNVVIVSD
jgi:hypothetical protein